MATKKKTSTTTATTKKTGATAAKTSARKAPAAKASGSAATKKAPAKKAVATKTTEADTKPADAKPVDAKPESKPADAKPAETKKRKRTGMSAIDAAAKVLSEAGEPMNCQAMIDAMAAKGSWTSPGGKTPAATLYAAIVREINVKGAESRFTKVDRGQFKIASK